MDHDALEERLRAVERALTDGDRPPADLPEAAELTDRLETLEDRTADLAARVDELDAAVQALRGYVGNVRSVNREVERRAEAALAAVDSVEAALDGEPPAPRPEPPARDRGVPAGRDEPAPVGVPGGGDDGNEDESGGRDGRGVLAAVRERL